jgi:aspartyl-tRNA(Asn)/glutamyl-tRNA(Gln) amidotransferase subunit A
MVAWKLSAIEMVAAFQASTLTPVQVLEACLDRIETVNPTLNAFVAMRIDGARADAQASTERYARAAALSPLDGVPIAIKDNLITSDLPTTWGSVAGRGYLAAQDELAVARAKLAWWLLARQTFQSLRWRGTRTMRCLAPHVTLGIRKRLQAAAAAGQWQQ